jgi:hypothetical protein
MRHARIAVALVLLAVATGVAHAAPTLRGRAVWANPREAGLTEASVDFAHFWPGVAAYQLYEEERGPLTRIRGLLRDGGKDVAGMQAAFDTVAPRLKTFGPEPHGALEAYLKDPKDPAEPAAKLDAFFASPPEGYYPPERLTKVLERVRAQDVEGVVIFSSGGITSAKLWKAVEEFFGK